MYNPSDVKENDEHVLDLRFASLSFFGLGELVLYSPNSCLIIARVFASLSPKFAQNLMLLLCRIHREIASGQIHDSK
jgi:hypothetical protein